ncbi:MAG: hypothetical protein U9R42_10275 [Bacteroidota bacterium]|nr:hypothetical protein [Bacteroidota bacterium]
MKNISKIRKAIILFLVFFFSLLLYTCVSHKTNQGQSYKEKTEEELVSFVFYNVENLFDTINNPETRDEEFLPEGKKKWGFSRYYNKLQKISKVLISISEWENPGIIGLCEVENRLVLEELLHYTPLKNMNYNIIHKESPDSRGIDVALLYNKKVFKVVFYDFYKINFPFENSRTTRDILYTKGVLKNTDTIHIFINHWPSRWGGKEVTEKKRMFVSSVLKSKTDSLFKINPNSKIVIMGDFNDEPFDKSISEVLKAGNDSTTTKSLFNFMVSLKQKGEGSYRYKFEWNMIDQIIVSTSFFNTQSQVYLNTDDAHIFKPDWLLIDDKKYPGKKPNRTFYGPWYNGGYSDHLPIYLNVHVRK